MTEQERLAIEVLAGELERRGLAFEYGFHPSEVHDFYEALRVAGFELRK